MHIIDDDEWLFGDPLVDHRIAEIRKEDHAITFVNILDTDATIQMLQSGTILTMTQAVRVMSSIGSTLSAIDRHSELCAVDVETATTLIVIKRDLVMCQEKILQCLKTDSGSFFESVAA